MREVEWLASPALSLQFLQVALSANGVGKLILGQVNSSLNNWRMKKSANLGGVQPWTASVILTELTATVSNMDKATAVGPDSSLLLLQFLGSAFIYKNSEEFIAKIRNKM